MNLFLLAIAPSMIIVLYMYFKDKVEREPFWLLVKNFFLGAIVSVILTFAIGGYLSNLMGPLDRNSVLDMFIKAFVVVALVEEFSKYVVLRF